MEEHSKWYEDTAVEIAQHRDRLTHQGSRKYKLGLLLRASGRVDTFASGCPACRLFQREISRVVEDTDNLSLMSQEQRKNYFQVIKVVVKHLKEEHKLIGQRHNIIAWALIGATIGIVISSGWGTTQIGIGAGVGAVIGLAIGIFLYTKSKKEGRLI